MPARGGATDTRAIDYDSLYSPRLSVPDYPSFASRWAHESQKARAALGGYLDVPYGPDPSEKLDIFRAEGRSRALLMFIHGGYWRALDKNDFSFIATEFVRAGVTVAVPNYALCPAVQVRDIVMQMVQACAWLYRNGANFGAPLNNLYVCGHSAGGHLTAMMLACVWPAYAADLPPKVVRAGLSISGLYDLRDLVKTPSVNEAARLTEETAVEVSPALMPPATDAPLYVAVGEKEQEGFHHQQRTIVRKWPGVLGAEIPCTGDHHFSVLDGLVRRDSALFHAGLRMMGL
jgi:arylformamidase